MIHITFLNARPWLLSGKITYVLKSDFPENTSVVMKNFAFS